MKDPDKLLPRQLAFCAAIVDGKNPSEAYRMAYNTEGWKLTTVHRRASDMMLHEGIRQRIERDRAALAAVATWQRGDSLRVLAEVAEQARDRPSARVAAVMALNKMLGYDAPTLVSVVPQIKIIWGDEEAVAGDDC
jgi:hypothetical protein